MWQWSVPVLRDHGESGAVQVLRVRELAGADKTQEDAVAGFHVDRLRRRITLAVDREVVREDAFHVHRRARGRIRRRRAALSVETTEPHRDRRELHGVFTGCADARTMSSTSAAVLTLVTQDECHFCEHAHEVLEALGVTAREIRVDSAEAQTLAERGIPLAFLPVLTDGERVIAYGRFSEKRLRKELGR